jgi:hypothetical protein
VLSRVERGTRYIGVHVDVFMFTRCSVVFSLAYFACIAMLLCEEREGQLLEIASDLFFLAWQKVWSLVQPTNGSTER